MQTIIMTVGTSLLTNPDKNLQPQRPWVGQKTIGDPERALAWMKKTDLELISAETNTYYRLDPTPQDALILLYSETSEGLECAQILQLFFEEALGQQQVSLVPLPGVNYELEGSSLERMAELLRQLAESAKGIVTFAATGGFKAQAMIMAVVGSQLGIPVCYIHEQYKSLVYLPYLQPQVQPRIPRAALPDSGRDRSQVIQLRSDSSHHRPRSWVKVEKLLRDLPWVDLVRYDSNAYAAPKNGVKAANRRTEDGRHILWVHLHESQDTHLAVRVETTGYTPDHLEQAAAELRERLGRLL
ncbi:putative CRISPR-associated protein (TIGR02619 family) [Thermostichus sp. MS-CIW-21]|jgi:putative CRISPR-associated protein (TIGR02619 family)|uniref:putative CRISPR-associated protein n=1 Tax=unclassified Synechococcus TaxID=2626047 RepID=UPI000C19A49D|nr:MULTISPECIES: putative CRISPR-associated protein [unclassified Synechococcus]PIK88810.1 CRISPR-associated protein [Synechococcus sp. 65AY6A5]PIK94611.1 CRISPR-associated protein [Synechococcus sp. 60AY4M2]PIK96867.1 CRISPR-associated protein [Synechococcus sp. 63AY4M1]PIK99439.1 CRISPR-associated protein [Synechococcus sp. 65AY640]